MKKWRDSMHVEYLDGDGWQQLAACYPTDRAAEAEEHAAALYQGTTHRVPCLGHNDPIVSVAYTHAFQSPAED